MRLFHLRILALIALITIINYIDRSAISFAILPIEYSLGVTNTEFGWIAGAFGIGYVAMAPLGSRIVDKFGPVVVWTTSAIVWSLVTMGMGIAQGFKSLFFLRIILGLAEGVHFSCVLRTLIDWLPPQARARTLMMGLFAIPVSSVIGAPFLSRLIDTFNWHTMFFVIGFLGIVWAVLWIMCFRKAKPTAHPDVHLSGENTLVIEKGIPWKTIFDSHAFQVSCFVYFAFGYTVFFALMWLPGYIEQTYGIDIRTTGDLVTIPWIVSAIFVLIGGFLSNKLFHFTHNLRISRSMIIGIGMGLSGIAFLCVASIPVLSINLLLLSIGLGCAFAINGPIYSLNSDLFHRYAGTAQGIMSLFFGLAGIVAPIITGWLAEMSGNFTIPLYLVGALSVTAAFLALFLQKPYTIREK